MSYNTFELTREAVRTALIAADDLVHEVIVVDNNSADGSASRLQQEFGASSDGQVAIIANDENRGFSAANNQGAALATGSVLYFLNSDTISHAGSIRLLHDFLGSHPDAGAVGPRALNTDGTDQQTTSRFPTPARLIRHHLPLGDLLQGKDRRDAFIPESTRSVDIVKGCALAMRREVYDRVEGWDESYFMYTEEAELCRSLVDAGYTNYYYREAVIMHYGEASTASTDIASQLIIQAQSSTQFIKRHYGKGTVLLNRTLATFGFAIRALVFPLLAVIRPSQAAEYRRRGEAASTLWRWFLKDHPH